MQYLMTIFHTLIGVYSTQQRKIYQIDFKNEILNGDIYEEVYMSPPPGIAHRSGEVFRLWKESCGLKQSHPAWFEKFLL